MARTQRETVTDWVKCRTNIKNEKRVYYKCNRSGCPRINNEELNSIEDAVKQVEIDIIEPACSESLEQDKSSKKTERERDSKSVISVKTYMLIIFDRRCVEWQIFCNVLYWTQHS